MNYLFQIHSGADPGNDVHVVVEYFVWHEPIDGGVIAEVRLAKTDFYLTSPEDCLEFQIRVFPGEWEDLRWQLRDLLVTRFRLEPRLAASYIDHAVGALSGPLHPSQGPVDESLVANFRNQLKQLEPSDFF